MSNSGGQVLSDFFGTTIPLAATAAIGTITIGSIVAVDAVDSWLGYIGIDGSGVVRYVGITSRDPVVRFAEHALDEVKAQLSFDVAEGAAFATKIEARIWEQTQINASGLAKNGGALLNKINSIAQKYWSGLGIGK